METQDVAPYSRVMSVDVVQGPISRHFGVGTIDVFTAGYTGMGGTAGRALGGPRLRSFCVPNFLELRDKMLSFVRHRPLFGGSTKSGDITADKADAMPSENPSEFFSVVFLFFWGVLRSILL